MAEDVVVRPAQTIDEYRACQDAQRLAWGLTDDAYLVPIATLVGAQRHGGLVLGAFTPQGKAVGLSFAFLGRSEGTLCLYSQLTGVVPGYQDQGLGTRMKLAQRDFALQQGIEQIVWAFDPLQAGNARFNLDQLGATAHRFVVDMYGSRTDALNRGTPSDRLIAVWPTAARPRPPIDGGELDLLPDLIERGAGGVSSPRAVVPPEPSARVRLEIPPRIARLRAEAPELAHAWQMAVRAAFERAFELGYRAVGFVRSGQGSGLRCHYLLESDRDSR